jgi:hypothetical protein
MLGIYRCFGATCCICFGVRSSGYVLHIALWRDTHNAGWKRVCTVHLTNIHTADQFSANYKIFGHLYADIIQNAITNWVAWTSYNEFCPRKGGSGLGVGERKHVWSWIQTKMFSDNHFVILLNTLKFKFKAWVSKHFWQKATNVMGWFAGRTYQNTISGRPINNCVNYRLIFKAYIYIHIIYKCGRGLHGTTRRATHWTPINV